MGDARELAARNVPRRALLPGEVPDRLCGGGEIGGQEPAAVRLGEDAGVAPALTGRLTDLLRYRAKIEDVDDEQIAWLGALDEDRPGQHVVVREVDVAHVVRRVVVADLAVGPFAALHPDRLTRPHANGRRDVGMPPVVARHGPIAHRTGLAT